MKEARRPTGRFVAFVVTLGSTAELLKTLWDLLSYDMIPVIFWGGSQQELWDPKKSTPHHAYDRTVTFHEGHNQNTDHLFQRRGPCRGMGLFQGRRPRRHHLDEQIRTSQQRRRTCGAQPRRHASAHGA